MAKILSAFIHLFQKCAIDATAIDECPKKQKRYY